MHETAPEAAVPGLPSTEFRVAVSPRAEQVQSSLTIPFGTAIGLNEQVCLRLLLTPGSAICLVPRVQSYLAPASRFTGFVVMFRGRTCKGRVPKYARLGFRMMRKPRHEQAAAKRREHACRFHGKLDVQATEKTVNRAARLALTHLMVSGRSLRFRNEAGPVARE